MHGMDLPPMLQLQTTPDLQLVRHRSPRPRKKNIVSSLWPSETSESCVTDVTVRQPVVDVRACRHAIAGCEL